MKPKTEKQKSNVPTARIICSQCRAESPEGVTFTQACAWYAKHAPCRPMDVDPLESFALFGSICADGEKEVTRK